MAGSFLADSDADVESADAESADATDADKSA